MRHGCLLCVIKHLEKASVLEMEAANGYPEFWTKVIAQLSEAEDEALEKHPLFAAKIRGWRIKYTGDGLETVGLISIPTDDLVGDALELLTAEGAQERQLLEIDTGETDD